MKKKLESIDYTGLNDAIRAQLGVHVAFATNSINEKCGRWYIDIVNQTRLSAGVMDVILKAFNITGDGSINDEGKLWMSMHFRYAHKSGGSNGMDMGTAWYNFDTKEWTYHPVKDS